ncbi:ATPase domain-containing protein [Haloarcula onubensis]|uniref:non-specific serine/threonine protein kinase n=1 Tax=Haloarcula onubensis TaxID=2950539 RepID=A0ABU2FVF4_9EURY|nr:ATPase domain-containing protein [Halomicroarcula sp. S3CR25-11]MDS0284121.1 AAA family ATPase [Halomicroarcula sp. S3CR25-11]
MSSPQRGRVSSGLAGLDEILQGGFIDERTYSIRGGSGTGKTILGYHFLTAGVEADETGLYFAFEETAKDITRNAESLGFELSDVEIVDMSPSATEFMEDGNYTVFGPSEVEGDQMVSRIGDAVGEHDPDRVFIDPLTLLRHLTPDEFQFKRTVASLMSYLKERGITTLFTTQRTSAGTDEDLQYLADGSIRLERFESGRRLEVEKFRGSGFRSGKHGLRIDAGRGLSVFPSLVPGDHGQRFDYETLSSDIDRLDELLGGGIERGSITLISGPSGVGKSTTGAAFASAAAHRGERSAAYLFEESRDSFVHRSEAVGFDVRDRAENGDFEIHPVEPLAVSADEFAHRVRTAVEERDIQFVMLDGTAGYRLALQDPESELRGELHALCRYLRNMGVTVLLTDEVTSVTGPFQASDSHVSYLADNVVFLRYIEVDGEIRKAIGVLKKRFGSFESTLRSFRIDGEGVHVGGALSDLRGVLTGTPTRDTE